MRLKNKRTGEIIEFDAILPVKDVAGDSVAHLEYDSLAELNAEWEDYEEPKEYWYIYADKPQRADCGDILEEDFKVIGNYFETKEEAELAVRKLKAWKRLKENGFRFKDYKRKFDGFKRVDGSVFITAELDDEGVIGMIDELNICFGGEE